MVTQEFADAVMQERAREAIEFQRGVDAQKPAGRTEVPRSGLSMKRIKRLPFLSFLTRGYSKASA